MFSHDFSSSECHGFPISGFEKVPIQVVIIWDDNIRVLMNLNKFEEGSVKNMTLTHLENIKL